MKTEEKTAEKLSNTTGKERANALLTLKREWQKVFYADLPYHTPTRQEVRRMKRYSDKKFFAAQKKAILSKRRQKQALPESSVLHAPVEASPSAQ